MAIINGRGRVGIRRPSAATTPSIILDGLKLYLDAGNATSYPGAGTVWTDLSGNGNNGTLVNGPTYSSANSGVIGFDGQNDYVTCADSSTIDLDNTVGFTVAFFNYRTSATAYQGYVGRGDNRGFQVYSQLNPLYILMEMIKVAGGYSSFNSTLTFPLNEWSYTCIRYNAQTSTLDFFQNNNKQTITSGVGGSGVYRLSETTPLYIGYANLVNRYFGGRLNNIMLYNRVLSDAEVAQNYDILKSRFYPQVSDTDAQSFIYAANIQNSTQASAVNTLVTSLKTAGIWTKMKAIYPFVGGSAASHKWNLKDPRDLDAAYRLTFTVGWVHSSTGAKPNGSSDYANTFLNGTKLTLYDAHLSYYSRTQSLQASNIEMGSDKIPNASQIICLTITRSNGNFTVCHMSQALNSHLAIAAGQTSTQGLFVNNRLGSNPGDLKAIKNGVVLATASANGTNIISSIGNVYIGALNNDGAGAAFFSNKEVAFSSIGNGLTDAESAVLYTAVQAYQTTLGRQV